MAEVTFDRVSKVYPDGYRAVNDVNLDIRTASSWCSSARPDAARPPRCGWSPGSRTSPRASSASASASSTTCPSRDRDIAMVFQSYALYPHLSVYENIAFGLKLKKMPKDEVERRVNDAARILGLDRS